MSQSLLNGKIRSKIEFLTIFQGGMMKSGPVIVPWLCLINSIPPKINQNHFQKVPKPFEWENSGKNRIFDEFSVGGTSKSGPVLGLCAWLINSIENKNFLFKIIFVTFQRSFWISSFDPKKRERNKKKFNFPLSGPNCVCCVQ